MGTYSGRTYHYVMEKYGITYNEPHVIGMSMQIARVSGGTVGTQFKTDVEDLKFADTVELETTYRALTGQ